MLRVELIRTVSNFEQSIEIETNILQLVGTETLMWFHDIMKTTYT